MTTDELKNRIDRVYDAFDSNYTGVWLNGIRLTKAEVKAIWAKRAEENGWTMNEVCRDIMAHVCRNHTMRPVTRPSWWEGEWPPPRFK